MWGTAIGRLLSAIRLLLRAGRKRCDRPSDAAGPPQVTAAGDTLKASGATWTLTGLNTGYVTGLSGTFAGMANLSDTSGGTLIAKDAIWTLTGPNAGSVSNLSGTFAGMVKLSDADEEKR